jgi:acetyl-CoA synthetase
MDSIHKDLSSLPKKPNILQLRENVGHSQEKIQEEIEFFSDGTLNIAHNAIDRHAKGEKKDKIALLFESATGEKESYTYGQLETLTNQFANVLKSQGIKKGDRVFVFLPTIPQRYIVFLGILKVGAIVGTMFSAFQEIALVDRLSDSQANMVVTTADLFSRIEKIWKDLPHLSQVMIVQAKCDATLF